MLRASSQDEGFDANLKAVMNTEEDPGVPHADVLRRLAESTIQGRWDDLATHRQASRSASWEFNRMVDALSVVHADSMGSRGWRTRPAFPSITTKTNSVKIFVAGSASTRFNTQRNPHATGDRRNDLLLV